MPRLNLLQLATALSFGLAASIASAGVLGPPPFVSFLENPDETTPIAVTTNLLNSSGGTSGVITNDGAETASVDGFLLADINSLAPLIPGTYWFGLTEPGSGLLSDLVQVIADSAANGTASPAQAATCTFQGVEVGCQHLLVSFFSDTEGGPPLALPPFFTEPPVLETGGVVQTFTISGTEGTLLTVDVRSDLDTVTVPEPSTLLLLAGGLGALFGTRRKSASRG